MDDILNTMTNDDTIEPQAMDEMAYDGLQATSVPFAMQATTGTYGPDSGEDW